MSLQWEEPKDPNEVLDYQLDWSNRLASGETIDTSEWTITAAAEGTPTLTEDSNTISSEKTIIWLSSGTVGVVYTLTNRIVTSGGRTMDQSVRLLVKAK